MQIDPNKPPHWIYVYEVTSSTVPEVPVGRFLVDKGRQLERTWDVWSSTTDEFTYFHGVRRERACSTCYAGKRLVRAHGHEHPHFEGDHLIPTSAQQSATV